MTSHARVGISRLVVGSVTFSALQRIGCPVLVVRARTPAPAPNTMVTLTPVLVPLDGSSLAEESLDAVVRALGTEGLALHLLHVQTASAEGKDWEAYLQSLAQRLSSQGMTVTWSVRQGHVAETIAQAAAETKSGLIAMATHGRGGLRQTLLGSTAEHVLHNARVPLLLIRPSPVKRPEEATVPPAVVSAGGEGSEFGARRLTLRARDLMTSPAITVSPDDTLEHVARTMLEHGIGAVPVVDEDGRLLGIISERDLMAQEQGLPFSVYRAPRLFGHWLPPEGLEEVYSLGRSLQARTVMRQPVVTVGEDATATQIAELMLETGRTHLPVVRDSRVVGMVTRHDLLKLLARGSQSSL
jgi:CBS domain-containing protein